MSTYILSITPAGTKRRLFLSYLLFFSWDEWVKDSRIYKDDEAGNKFKAEVEKLV